MIMMIGKIVTDKKYGKMVFIPKDANDLFDREDDVKIQKAVIIKRILKKAIYFNAFGKFYEISALNMSEEFLLYTRNTVNTLFALGAISHNHDKVMDYLLAELLQNEVAASEEVLDVVYNSNPTVYPKKRLTAFLSLAKSKEAAKWLLDHGAKLETAKGFGNPVRHYLDNRNSKLINYLLYRFNYKDTNELLKSVKEAS